jgi:hypothetical protein
LGERAGETGDRPVTGSAGPFGQELWGAWTPSLERLRPLPVSQVYQGWTAWFGASSWDQMGLPGGSRERVEAGARTGDLVSVQFQTSVSRVLPARLPFEGWPSALSEDLHRLNGVWLTGLSYPAWRIVSAPSNDTAFPVVMEYAVLERWEEAARGYVLEIQRLAVKMSSRWDYRLPFRNLPGGRTLWRWRLEGLLEQARSASERYRPVAEEVQAVVEETRQVYAELADQLSVVHAWYLETRWYLMQLGEQVCLVRAEEADRLSAASWSETNWQVEESRFGEGPHAHPLTRPSGRRDLSVRSRSGASRGTLRHVTTLAGALRFHREYQVSWDEASVARCDSELTALEVELPLYEDLFQRHALRYSTTDPGMTAIGRTASGKVMTYLVPATLARVHQLYLKVPMDHLTDPESLVRERRAREWHEQAAAEMRERYGPGGSSVR